MKVDEWNRSTWFESWVQLARATSALETSLEHSDPSNPVHIPEDLAQTIGQSRDNAMVTSNPAIPISVGMGE